MSCEWKIGEDGIYQCDYSGCEDTAMNCGPLVCCEFCGCSCGLEEALDEEENAIGYDCFPTQGFTGGNGP